MGYAGKPDLWADLFPDDLLPTILDLVLESWKVFQMPVPTEHEVPITKRFCDCLRQWKDRSRVPFTIWTESEELEPGSGELLGRIDLRLLHGYREQVYFAFECKRLNVVANGKRSSLTGDYVKKGMMRFITGQYAEGLDKGGMLGYVMDGKVGDAVGFVKKAVESWRTMLKMQQASTLTTCSIRPQNSGVRQTRHRQDKRPFLIYHLFLAVR